MEVKERRPYCSLTKSRRDKDSGRRYTGSYGDSEDAPAPPQRVPTQKSYSSSETLKAFDTHHHADSSRLLYTHTQGRVKDMVHRQQEDFSGRGDTRAHARDTRTHMNT